MTMESIFRIDKTTETSIAHLIYSSWKSQDPTITLPQGSDLSRKSSLSTHAMLHTPWY